MQPDLAALESALEQRRQLIEEWISIGRPTPRELLERIDTNDRRILQLREVMLACGHTVLPD
jgi:hypothetical protein